MQIKFLGRRRNVEREAEKTKKNPKLEKTKNKHHEARNLRNRKKQRQVKRNVKVNRAVGVRSTKKKKFI